MPEIKTPITPWVYSEEDGDCDGFLIEEKHTLKDILRHVLSEVGGDKDEFLYLATEVFNEAD